MVARVPERAQLAQRHRARVREHPHCASGQQGGTRSGTVATDLSRSAGGWVKMQ